MKQYLDLMEKILAQGEEEMDRTGVGTLSIHNEAIHFDLSKGFPICTTKQVSLKMVATELEFFIKGLTDKQWLKDRKCNIWNEWCAPYLMKDMTFNSKEEKLAFQAAQADLGPIYGYQWRNWGGDQLTKAIKAVRENPMDRAIIVSAWNADELSKMALRPCHTQFQLLVRPSGKLDLSWFQRSCDAGLGIPYNIASYALLCNLIAKECNLQPGKLTGFLGDVHLYKNHLELARQQITRTPGPLPTLQFKKWDGFWNWEAGDCELIGYEHQGKIPYEMTAI